MNLREFWAAEAAKLRDTSALLDTSHLDVSENKSQSHTIVTTENGKRQFVLKNTDLNAIAIFSDKSFDIIERSSLSDFLKLRAIKKSAKFLYMVDGMIKLEKFALTQKVDYTKEWYLDKNGNRITNLYPEESAPLEKNDNVVTVDFAHQFVSQHHPRASNSSGGHYHHIHIHTNGYRPDIAKIVGPEGVRFNDPNFGGDITSPPSTIDWETVIDCPLRNPANNAYNVIVSPGHIHLYNHLPGKEKHHIIINRSNLSKANQR
jgi:hypothetical protein